MLALYYNVVQAVMHSGLVVKPLLHTLMGDTDVGHFDSEANSKTCIFCWRLSLYEF